jgi:hypothetical protein
MQAAFEFGPNFLEVQTYLEKSDNFPKIIICLDLPECEFIYWYGCMVKFVVSIEAPFDLV